MQRRNSLKFEITAVKADRADVMHFSRQLSAFIKAGVPIADAIEMLQAEMKDKVLKASSPTWSRPSAAATASPMQSHLTPTPSHPFYVSVLKSVEMTGKLDTVLDQLSQYLERDLEARRKIKAALAYPVMVLVMSFATVAIMAGFVLPRFKTLLRELRRRSCRCRRACCSASPTSRRTFWWAILLRSWWSSPCSS